MNTKHPFFTESHFKVIDNPKGYPDLVHNILCPIINNQITQDDPYDLLALYGIVDMLKGLEYHFTNFVKLENRERKMLFVKLENMERKMLKVSGKPDLKGVWIHEFIAYINRLGQIYYYLNSRWFQKNIKLELGLLCPTLLSLLPFRNKFSVHRSFDYPYNESDTQQAWHAGLPYINIWIGSAHLDHNKALEASYLCSIIHINSIDRSKHLKQQDPIDEIEYFSRDQTVILQYSLTRNHKKICDEILQAIKLRCKK